MYRKQISQKALPSPRVTPKNQAMPRPSYGSLSSVVQRAQQDPDSVSGDERQQLESAIGTRSTREILAGKQTPWIPEFRGISVQMWGDAGQVGEPIQAKGKDNVDISEVQSENKTGLPDDLKAGVENLSGYSLDEVRVHDNSPKPDQLQALAYTQGTEIHVASGQEEHLPHEAWHVVQQMQGRVKPTMQMKGVQINDDQGLEKEADVMGWRASHLLENAYQPMVSQASIPIVPVNSHAIQRIRVVDSATGDEYETDEMSKEEIQEVALRFYKFHNIDELHKLQEAYPDLPISDWKLYNIASGGSHTKIETKQKSIKGKLTGESEEISVIPSDEVADDFSELGKMVKFPDGLEVPAYWLELDFQTKDDLWVSELPRDHKIFRLIENYISQGIEQSPYTSEKQEATRMQHAQEILDKDESTDLMKEKARLRLREGERGGAERVGSGPIEITRIKVIANTELWQAFTKAREGLRQNLIAHDTEPLKKVQWATAQSPVVNKSIGESFLLHGTSSDIMDRIEKGGFRPDLGKNKGTDAKPKYGLLGQGSYFSDLMSKVMTYANCPICGDYHCDCTDENDKPPTSEVFLARTLLGHPKKMHGFIEQGGSLRSQDVNTIKAGRDSIYSKGWNVSKNPFSSGSGTNEFLIKKAEQIYPEFRIYWRHK